MDHPEVILDLSRLLSRLRHPTPTGVDRVEMAYARGLLAQNRFPTSFAAMHPLGLHGLLRKPTVIDFLDALQESWTSHDPRQSHRTNRFVANWLLKSLPTSSRRMGPTSLYLQASPNNIQNAARMRKIIRRMNSRLICVVHDLIPLEYPEYARPDGAAKHEQRVRTMLELSDGLIANSHATLASLDDWSERLARHPPSVVAHLGTDKSLPIGADKLEARPYFLCIGTIEPRKNHLLLLNLWRQMASDRDRGTIPKLILVGRRGWENEQIIDMLERCPSLRACVEERGRTGDASLRALLKGCNGLLLPSFAEGYGMPVAEAIELNVPVICSDLPALREAGGNVPLFLNPLDGPAWQQAIDDLTHPDSGIAAAQASRRGHWSQPTWDDHMILLLDFLERVARS